MNTQQTKLKERAMAHRRNLIEELGEIAKEKGIDQKAIAKKTGILQPAISQTMSGDINIGLDRFLQMCEAIGVKFIISESLSWISVKERLPTVGDEYNVVWDLKDGKPPVSSTMDFDAISKQWFDEKADSSKPVKTVLFWQPIPKPSIK